MEYVVSFLIGLFVGMIMRNRESERESNPKLVSIEGKINNINKEISTISNIIKLRKEDRRKWLNR